MLATRTRLAPSFALTASRIFQPPVFTRIHFNRISSVTESGRISDAITHDHRELEEYYDNILNATDHDTKTRWQNQFCWELARHSIAEELVVYPSMEKNLGAVGEEKAEKDRGQHRTLKEQLKTFQDMKSSDPEFEPTIRSLMADLAQHIKEEESDDLPKLEEALVTEDSMELAKSFQLTKYFVPSRSHPSAPDRPPLETLAGLLAAPIDRLGDMFRKFPKS